jgi:hypothetical protein
MEEEGVYINAEHAWGIGIDIKTDTVFFHLVQFNFLIRSSQLSLSWRRNTKFTCLSVARKNKIRVFHMYYWTSDDWTHANKPCQISVLSLLWNLT